MNSSGISVAVMGLTVGVRNVIRIAMSGINQHASLRLSAGIKNIRNMLRHIEKNIISEIEKEGALIHENTIKKILNIA